MLDLHMSFNLFEMNSNHRLEFGVCSISMLSFFVCKINL